MKTITVIIPYKIDRGWLKDAIGSVPSNVQLIVSRGNGNWPQNFNKVLPQAEGDFIKFLHEDDMLTQDSIHLYLEALELPIFKNVDFIHGNAIELHQNSGQLHIYKPSIELPTLQDLIKKNVIHSATLLYSKEIFRTLGGFNESSKMYSFEEYEFNLRCLHAGFKIGYINASLAYYRRHPKQIIRTCNIEERKINRAELLKQYQ